MGSKGSLTNGRATVALNALADLPENKRARTELKEGIDSCNMELVLGTYNPPLAAD